MMLTMATFVLATAAVAAFTYIWVSRLERSSNPIDDYFAGGRGLAWPVVGGSLLLTNLSTEQLVGLNGAVFKDGNLVGVAWEALAAFAMIATALLFLPRYLASGFTTTPAFLEQRYDRTTRQLVSALFLFGYVTVLLPVVLYTGSLALKTMFDLEMPLWWVVVGIGTLGSAYAIFGGLRTVAVSDTLNGVGLLIGGLAVPFLALAALGDGSFVAGCEILARERPESLATLALLDKSGEPASVPWPTLLTGMMFIQVFYWSTNQVIVQRAMGARSLAEGQKGVLFASVMKLVGPLMLCLPGIIALHMTDVLNITANDQVYPAIVRHVLPDWSLGLFGAVLVGAILSSFNSALNSASTLFCIDFYEPRLIARGLPEDERAKRTVRVGRLFATGLALAAMAVAPKLAQMESIFEYLQKINGLYSVPIIAIFLVGLLSRRAPAAGAKVALVVGIGAYAAFTFFEPVPGLHWLHGYFISTALAIAVLIAFALACPRTDLQLETELSAASSPVDMTPWPHARRAAAIIVTLTIFLYAALQGLAS